MVIKYKEIGNQLKIPNLTIQDFSRVDERSEDSQEFTGVLNTEQSVRCIPIKKESTQKDRLLSIYTTLSSSVNVQKIFGVVTNDDGEYAVMEQLDGQTSPYILLSEAFTENTIASVVKASRIHRLRLCYEIAVIMAYLHSLNFIVKVVSETSIYLREDEEDLIPVMTNLEHARLVYSLPCVTDS